MKIDTIFAVVNESLLTVKFHGKEKDELANLFDNWTDVEWKTDPSNTLQRLFKPLNDEETSIPALQESKLKGSFNRSWLRIYAIRIGPNLFVITGGGIKLTHKMEQSLPLKEELLKLETTKEYLKELGIWDEDDYEFLEL